jgi:hypothetical protein
VLIALGCLGTSGTETGAPGTVDADGDGFADGQDCDDARPGVNPEAPEVCGGGDEDCDGATDEPSASDAPLWYWDGDGDGYGVTTMAQAACVAPDRHASVGGDCDFPTLSDVAWRWPQRGWGAKASSASGRL